MASHQSVGASDRRHEREDGVPPSRTAVVAVPFFVLLAHGLAALFFGGSSPVEAQGGSSTLMCAPGWEMVGTRCRYLSFGIQVLWRDAIYCQAGTQPNPAHSRCVPIPEPDPVSPPPSSGDDDEDDDEDDDDGSDGLTSVIGPPIYYCTEGHTFNPATNRCEADTPLAAPSVSNFRVPSGAVVDTVFPVATGGTPPYTYSLSGLPPGIDFTSSTRRAHGTLPTVLIDTTYTITYTVSDSAGATDSFTFTTVVTAPTPPPTTPTTPDPPTTTPDPPTTTPDPPTTTPNPPTTTPDPPTATPNPPTPSGPIVKTGVNVSSSRTYLLRLSESAEVSVELTGMTRDFDCRVSGNRCTNYGGTRDDSWSGTLGAGDHKVVVYPYGGGTGDYTVTIDVQTPSTGGSTGTETRVTTLVDVSETNVSASRTYSFTLAESAEVDVALTDLTIDFDCRVGSSRCTNRWGMRDDSWNGNLAAGTHSVVVYPYDPGPGDYSLTVTTSETVAVVVTPLAGGPVLMGRLCDADENGNPIEDTCQNIYADVTTVTGDDPGPPPGAGPGEGTPGPGDGGDDDGGGGGGGTLAPTQVGVNPAALTSRIRDCGWNFNEGDLFGAPRSGGRTHTGIDVQTHSDARFFAFRGGVVELPPEQPESCGWYVRIRHDDGGYEVHCRLDRDSRPVAGSTVEAGDHVGSWGGSGVHGGPHHHFKLVGPDGSARDPLEDRSPAEAAGFTFATGPEQCEAAQ